MVKQEKTLTILSTSDTHGYVYPTDFRKKDQSLPFGLTKILHYVNQVKDEQQEDILVIDNGDFLQGSPLSYYVSKHSEDYNMALAMNHIGYDFGVLGNHEFNYGIAYLRETMSALNYPILCANILNDDGTYFTGHPYAITEKNGLKIGVIGLTTPYIPHWEQPKTIEGLVFKSALETAKELVPLLRPQVDILVVSYHGGFEKDLETGNPTETLTGENEGYDILRDVEGIDVLLSGHQHREIAMEIKDTFITQPGDKGRYIGRVDLTLVNEGTSRIIGEAQLIPMTHEEEADALVSECEDLLEAVETWLDSPLGSIVGDMRITDPMAVRVQGHPYIEFVQDVQKEATRCDISGTALFDNNGTGFKQEITMRDIVTNYIYPNTLAVLEISGHDLLAALERSASYFDTDKQGELVVSKAFLEPKVEHYNYDLFSGIDYTIDVTQPVGNRITRCLYKGQPVDAIDSLQVVMNQYRAVGGGDYTMFGPDKIIKEITVDMTELMSNYLEKHPVYEAKQPRNMTVIY